MDCGRNCLTASQLVYGVAVGCPLFKGGKRLIIAASRYR
nr:MAG TPA: hypothetical protein [Inoviridae sp.]